MKLHDEPEIFSELTAAAARHIGLPEVYVEKDYWVTKALRNLSLSDFRDAAVFKGGTSLSKAYRIIDRFSEDIDLAVFADGKSANAVKKLLKRVETAVAEGLTQIDDDPRISKGSSFRKTVHEYARSAESGEFGQASPELLIEVNSFTNPEPFEEKTLQSLIAKMLRETERKDLIVAYELQPFDLLVLSLERTLAEKILGVIKDSYHDDPTATLSRRIRHLYDITLILRREEIRAFVSGEKFQSLCANCIEDEKVLFEDTAHLFERPLGEAPIFAHFPAWRSSLEATYNGDFKNLVYGALPHMDEIEQSLSFLKQQLE